MEEPLEYAINQKDKNILYHLRDFISETIVQCIQNYENNLEVCTNLNEVQETMDVLLKGFPLLLSTLSQKTLTSFLQHSVDRIKMLHPLAIRNEYSRQNTLITSRSYNEHKSAIETFFGIMIYITIKYYQNEDTR